MIYFSDSENVLLVKFEQGALLCFDEAEVDTVNGLHKAIDLKTIGDHLYVVTTIRSGTDDYYVRDPVKDKINN